MILGRKWLAHHGVLIDFQKGQLYWPPGNPPERQPTAITLQDAIEGKPQHQEDADRRENLFEKEIKQEKQQRIKQILQRPASRSTSLKTPCKETKLELREEASPTEKSVQFAFIGAHAFDLNVKNQEIMGTVSI